MRLLFITQDFPPETGGIQTYSYELSKRIAKNTDYFCVLAPKSKGADSFDEKSTFNIRRFNIPNTLLFIILLFKLPRIIKSQSIDIIYHTQWQTLWASVRTKRKGKIQQIAAAAHARELLFNPFGTGIIANWYDRYKKRLLKQVDIWYPVSDYTAKLLIDQGVDAEKIKVMINGTNPQQYYPKNVDDFKEKIVGTNKKVVLTVTRLVDRKGIDLVIKSMRSVIKSVPNAFYVIVGDGPIKAKLQHSIDAQKLNQNVRLVGRVKYEDLINYYNMADVFVMPSKTELPDVEGFGIVFLEANACAKPVIGSNSGGIPSAIKNGYNGLIVEENNIEQLTDAITTILNNPEMAKEMGENGLNFVKNEANWEEVSKKIIKDLNNRINK